MRWHAIAALLAGLVSTSAGAQQPPSGWRFLVPADRYIDAERVSLPMTRARGDFNGDGKRDVARILVQSRAADRFGVFVFVQGADPSSTPSLLEEFQGGEYMLSTVKKGCYSTFQKDAICLASTGILRLETEFGSGVLHWLKHGKWQQTEIARGDLEGR